MTAQAEIPPGLSTLRHAAAETLRSRWVRYGAGVLALEVAYYAAG
jgi:hypothetical protein